MGPSRRGRDSRTPGSATATARDGPGSSRGRPDLYARVGFRRGARAMRLARFRHGGGGGGVYTAAGSDFVVPDRSAVFWARSRASRRARTTQPTGTAAANSHHWKAYA